MKQWNCKLPVALAAAVVAVVSAGLSTPVTAQSFYGSIVGTVTDPTGAIVPGAKVTVTNLGTNEKHASVSDAAGVYRVVNLVPASYKVDVEKSGFKHVTRDAVEVLVGSESRIDVAMQIGAATETVEVTSLTPLLQTESGAETEAVEGERVQEMPLNGRNTMNLLALNPGVVSGVPSGASALNMGTHTQAGAWADYSISGGFTGATAMYLDGASLNLLQQNPIAFIPTQDATQEFQVMSSGISPEFGRFGGGVVNMTTKSGTNQWHGSAYEYFRNKVLNANSFFSNRNGVARGTWNQDQYGVTLGSPIKRDKIFSFFSWEGFRLLVGVPGATNVPTDAMRAGKIYSSAPVNDPFHRAGCTATGSDAGGSYTQINPACFDPTANAMVNVVKYWPEPLQPNNPNSNFNNVPDTGNNANQYTERIDYNLSDKQRLFARYTYWGQVDLPYNELENFTENSFSHNRSTQAVLGDTYTISPTSIVDVRLAFLRQFTDNQPGTLNKDLTPLGGAWPTLQSQMNPKYFPGPHVLGTGLYPFFGMNVDSYDYLNSYDLGFSLTQIKGSHSLKFGGEIRLSDSNAPGFTLDGGGFFAFVGLPWLSGNNFADFLFGTPASGSIQKVSPSSSYNWYQGYYAADTWQVSRKLTLNYGLRWELPGSIGERNNKDTVLLPNTRDPTTGAPGTEALVGSSLYSSQYVTDVRHDLFAPRLGFAYRVTNTTVVRGGYGITYLPPDMAAGVMSNSSPVNTMTTGWNNLPFGSTALGPGTFSVLSNPFPTTGILPPVGRTNPTSWTAQLADQAISGPVPHQPYANTQQWNLNVGHQFPGDVMVEVAYNGSTSNNLPAIVDLNELPKSDWTSALATQANQPYGTYYTDVQDSAAMVGAATYNSGLVKVEKRFKSGGVISGNYTYSRSLADDESSAAGGFGNGAQSVPNSGNFIGYGPQDSEHLRSEEYSLSSFDIPHRLMASYVLNLPFGEGQKWAHYGGAAGTMVSGWTVNGITDYQKGFPMSMNQATDNITLDSFGYGSTVSGGAIRPNKVAGCNAAISGTGKNRINEWFKTSCYTVAPDLTLGNEPRADPQVRTDGIANWDVSLLKATKIHENVNAQFRAEFFNTFNHPQFAAPQNAVDDPVNFGVVIAQMNNPRLVQFSLRINF